MRSGTHLTIDLIRKQFDIGGFKYPGEPLDCLYLPLDTLATEDNNANTKVFNKIGRFNRPIFKSHYLSCDLHEFSQQHPSFRSWLLESGTWIYVIRDPVSVMASLYQFETGYRAIADVNAWLIMRAQSWADHVRRWIGNRPDIHILKFEEIVGGPEIAVHQLSSILDMPCRMKTPLLPKRLGSIWRSRLLRLFAVTCESTEILTDSAPTAISRLCRPATITAFNEVTESARLMFGYPSVVPDISSSPG